jgi:hypothetical protein
MTRALPFLLLALAGCGEAVRDDHFANGVTTAPSDPVASTPEAVPVRIGELGANFNACNAAGTTRNLDSAAGQRLQVRAAPFDAAAETGAIAADARFYICTRSHDQRWLGVVYEEAGSLAESCGVSRPVAARRNYDGPCRSGWVSAAFVKQIAG